LHVDVSFGAIEETEADVACAGLGEKIAASHWTKVLKSVRKTELVCVVDEVLDVAGAAGSLVTNETEVDA
jgi:pyruvate/2-oxoglutarate/acetoin dehydrogenase E1 component